MRACASLGRLDQNTSDAVKARQEVDLRIGNYPYFSLSSPSSLHLFFPPFLLLSSLPFSLASLLSSASLGCAFTRFQTMRLTKVFPQVLSDQLISYGPCQFPTLGFVVERVSSKQHKSHTKTLIKQDVHACLAPPDMLFLMYNFVVIYMYMPQ